METFPYVLYPPTYGADESINDAILESRFGDGYSQSVPDGINFRRSKWSLTWENYPIKHADIIWVFLRPKVRLEPFMWKTEGLDRELQVKCSELKRSWPKFGVYTITATFETSYDLG